MPRRLAPRLLCLVVAQHIATDCYAGGMPATELPTMQVVATTSGEEIDASAASAGVVDSTQLAERPISRPAEVLEVVPGLIATQHSGDGKANQYFLRGFNLDHGTDLSASIDGVPNNLRTHGHGQGYNDLNGLIPELINTISYRKGPYDVADGDFSSAGSVAIRYKDRLDGDFLQLTGGLHGYARGLVAASGETGTGNWLAAADLGRYDGPWKKPEGEHRLSLLARLGGERDDIHWWLETLVYHNRWDSTDQIPERAVDAGLISRLGQIDLDLGGNTSRATLTGGLRLPFAGGELAAQAYAVRYRLTLTSDFTYFLDDPVNGDQFQQVDRRWVYGGALDYRRRFELGGTHHRLHVGVDLRDDDIGTVGLYHTAERERLSTVRQDGVDEASLGSFVGVDSRWNDWLRSEVGARYDLYHARVDSNIADNSGHSTDHQASPKASLVLGPWLDSELFLNVGRGYHSNDARGATLTVDPIDPATPAAAQALLVPTLGSEIGMRTRVTDDLTLSASLWRLRIGSELVFSGDGGTTEASYPSLRSGLELSAYYRPTDWLLVDADFAQSHASFRNNPAGNRVPNAVERAASMGVEVTGLGPWSGGLRYRYLGPAPLIEDNSARSKSTTLVNAEVGYKWSDRVQLRLEALNLLDSKRNDITYFYESQLPHEPSPVADTHFHPVEPRQFRLGVRIGL